MNMAVPLRSSVAPGRYVTGSACAALFALVVSTGGILSLSKGSTTAANNGSAALHIANATQNCSKVK